MIAFAAALCVVAAVLAAAAPRGEQLRGFARNFVLILAVLLTLVTLGGIVGHFLRGAIFG